MKILWMTWKDRKHPHAGGAEVVNEELAKRLVADGHEVIFLVAGYDGAVAEETVDGYKIIRLGSRYSVYWQTYRYYKKHMVGWADLVVDEVNTMPFFAKFYVREKNILFVHQLARQVWFHQIFFPLSIIGYITEPLFLWGLRKQKVVTVSESTKQDLIKYGFKQDNISIISEGIDIKPVKSLKAIKKYPTPTLLSHGAIRAMKRTHHQIVAFEIAKKSMPNLQLKLSGEAVGRYGKKVQRYIAKSKYRKDIEYYGKVSNAKKIELMQRSHFILSTAIKEGWGLTITEAASQGTPAIVYDSDGLRDSVLNNKTGYVVTNKKPHALASKINKYVENIAYDNMRINAWQTSKQITFDKSYIDLLTVIKI